MIDRSFGSIISCLAQIHCSVFLPRTSAWFVRCTVQFSKNHRSSSDLIILPHSKRFVKWFFKIFFIALSNGAASSATGIILSHPGLLCQQVFWIFYGSGFRVRGSGFRAPLGRVGTWLRLKTSIKWEIRNEKCEMEVCQMIFWNLFQRSFERGRFISDGYNIITPWAIVSTGFLNFLWFRIQGSGRPWDVLALDYVWKPRLNEKLEMRNAKWWCGA